VGDPKEVVVYIPKKGSYTWPGRDALDDRTRVLLESRTIDELMDATSELETENLESVLGYWNYLQSDWRWLHDSKFRKKNPKYVSPHNASLRAGGHYLRSTKWRGSIPKTDSPLDHFALLRN
jgi:hypothetical protein